MTVKQTRVDTDGQGENAARRRFLRTAVVGGVSLVGALPVVAASLHGTATAAKAGGEMGSDAAGVVARDAGGDPLLDVLQRYGSELGGATRVR